KYPAFTPRHTRIGRDADSMFAALRRQDVLLHHPFESYEGVVNFLRTASRDPRVLSVKQTLYRTNTNSPIAQALLDAAGKKDSAVRASGHRELQSVNGALLHGSEPVYV